MTVAFAFFTADTAKPGGMTPTLKSDASATAIQDFRNTIGRSPSVTSANDAGDHGKQAHLSREAATPSIVKRQQTPSDGDYRRGMGTAAFGSPSSGKNAFFVTGGATFVPLFNGRDLSGWRMDGPHDAWKVEGGVIVGLCEAITSWILTEGRFTDFTLRLEFLLGKLANGKVVLPPRAQHSPHDWYVD